MLKKKNRNESLTEIATHVNCKCVHRYAQQFEGYHIGMFFTGKCRKVDEDIGVLKARHLEEVFTTSQDYPRDMGNNILYYYN